MTGWLVLAAYLCGWAFTARKAAFMFRNEDDGLMDQDRIDRLATNALGCVVGLVWPLVLISAGVTWRLPKTDSEIRAALIDRDARIAELERELGIGASR